MRNRIFGAIGVIWGGLILLNAFAGGITDPAANANYNFGRYLAVALGALMFGSGLYYLIAGDGSGKKKKKKKKARNAIRTPI